MKKVSKRIVKVIIFVTIVAIIILLAQLAWSKYVSSIKGNASADLAKWNFEVIDGIPSTKDVLDFAITRQDGNEHVAKRTVSTTEQVGNL